MTMIRAARMLFVILASSAAFGALACNGAGSDSEGGGGSGGCEDSDCTGFDAGSPPFHCGVLHDALCFPDMYCELPEGNCNAPVELGWCTHIPVACTSELAPACACDGEWYVNACIAKASSQTLSAIGGCRPNVGMFPCGAYVCDAATQYCFRGGGGAMFFGVGFCRPFPESCFNPGPPSCDCIDPGYECFVTPDGIVVQFLAP